MWCMKIQSSTASPKPGGVPAQPIKLQKVEPPRCLGLRTRGMCLVVRGTSVKYMQKVSTIKHSEVT